MRSMKSLIFASLTLFLSTARLLDAQPTVKPALHGKHWVAITGKPLAATAGAMIFARGGNAVDATCAMLAAACTMFDSLSWGGETQALIFNPETGKVIGINALGVAPTDATPEFFKEKELEYPPATGPLAAVTPGTPGGLMVMLAEFGTLSLKEVLAPAMQMAAGYPIEGSQADNIEGQKKKIKEWTYSRDILLPHLGDEEREAPYPGEVFRQPDLLKTLENWSRPSSRPWPPERIARLQSWPPMTASTGATSPRNSSGVLVNREACTRSRTWRTGKST